MLDIPAAALTDGAATVDLNAAQLFCPLWGHKIIDRQNRPSLIYLSKFILEHAVIRWHVSRKIFISLCPLL